MINWEDAMQLLTQFVRGSLLAATVAVTMPSGAISQEFYDGKTIDVIVGASAGSGGDVSARTLMAGLAERIPGNPNIIVRNMEGAGGAVALNFVFEKADPGRAHLLLRELGSHGRPGGWRGHQVPA